MKRCIVSHIIMSCTGSDFKIRLYCYHYCIPPQYTYCPWLRCQPYPGRQQQQQHQHRHQEGNNDQGVEESKGEGKNEQLHVETQGGGHQIDVTAVNMSTASSAMMPRLATNNNNNVR